MKKIICIVVCLLLACVLFAQKYYSEPEKYYSEPEIYVVEVFSYIVDGTERVNEIARALYVFDSENGVEELYLYSDEDVLIESLMLGDYDVEYQEEDYEEIYFYDVTASSYDGVESLMAYAEYDYIGEYIYWEIFDSETEETLVEIEFW
jgi:hypothetical protein